MLKGAANSLSFLFLNRVSITILFRLLNSVLYINGICYRYSGPDVFFYIIFEGMIKIEVIGNFEQSVKPILKEIKTATKKKNGLEIMF